MQAVFAGHPGRQESLRIMWPELYDAITGKGEASLDSTRAAKQYCPICSTGDTPPAGGRRKVTARLWRNGAPGCATCVERSADRPGGWPLIKQEGKP